MDALHALKEEMRANNLLRVEPEMGGENWQARKYTEKLVGSSRTTPSAMLNGALVTANRAGAGGTTAGMEGKDEGRAPWEPA